MNRDTGLETGFRAIAPGIYLGHFWSITKKIRKSEKGNEYLSYTIRVRLAWDEKGKPLSKPLRWNSKRYFSNVIASICNAFGVIPSETSTNLSGMPCKVYLREYEREEETDIIDFDDDGRPKFDQTGAPIKIKKKVKSVSIDGFVPWKEGKKMTKQQMDDIDEIEEERTAVATADEEEDIPF